MTYETVDKIRALNVEVEDLRAFRKRNNCGYSSNGYNLFGDAKSIAYIKECIHAKGNEEFYRKAIQELRDELQKVKEALG